MRCACSASIIIIDCNKTIICEGLESLIFHVVILNKPQPWMERSYSEYTRIWRKMQAVALPLLFFCWPWKGGHFGVSERITLILMFCFCLFAQLPFLILGFKAPVLRLRQNLLSPCQTSTQYFCTPELSTEIPLEVLTLLISKPR